MVKHNGPAGTLTDDWFVRAWGEVNPNAFEAISSFWRGPSSSDGPLYKTLLDRGSEVLQSDVPAVPERRVRVTPHSAERSCGSVLAIFGSKALPCEEVLRLEGYPSPYISRATMEA